MLVICDSSTDETLIVAIGSVPRIGVDAEQAGGLDGLGEMMGTTCSDIEIDGVAGIRGGAGPRLPVDLDTQRGPSLKSFGLGLFVDPKMVEIDGGGAEVSVTYQGGALEGWTVVSRSQARPTTMSGRSGWKRREPLTAERLICSMTSTDQRNVTP